MARRARLADALAGRGWAACLESGIREVRSRLGNRSARVLCAPDGGTMVLLHGFIKKDHKTPRPEMDLAEDRLKQLKRRK